MNLPRINDLPTNLEAEQAVLGAILVNNLAFHAVSELLRPEHFADPMHGTLYDAIARLLNRGQTVNGFSLKAYVDAMPELNGRGSSYLASLMTVSVHVADAGSMARVVRDAAIRRGLVGIAQEAMVEACEPQPEDSASDQIGRVEKRLYELAEGNVEGGFAGFNRSLTEAVKGAEAAHKRRGKLSGVTTGLRSLNRLLGGLHPSDLIILAARPSMGKTSMATGIGVAAAQAYRTETAESGEQVTVDGASVGFFSLEMSADQLATRIIAEQAQISSDKVRKGELNAAEFDRFLTAAQAFEALPFWIDDTPALSLSAIRTRARRLKRQHGCGLLVIDHLQLIEPDDKRRNGNRVEDVSAITKGLKALAKELAVPVVVLSQLSRQVEQRQDKRPQLSDLRESGSIEQDADLVMFLYREEYYLRRQGLDVPRDIADRADVLVQKARQGPIGDIAVKFEAWLTRFSDLEAP